jgi:predicted DNA-binding transcriptional regulator AlpA
MPSTVHPDIENALTIEQAATYLGLKNIQTLHNWRSLHIGPAYFKIGMRVRYRKADIDAWVQKKIIPTYESEPVTAA